MRKNRVEALDVIRTAWARENKAPTEIRNRLLEPGIAAWLVGNLIYQGTLSSGDRLPTNIDIGGVLGMSGRSVSTGLRILEERGVLHAQEDKVGTIITGSATPDDLNAITQTFQKAPPTAKSYPAFPSQVDRDTTHRLAAEAKAANQDILGRDSVLALVDSIADDPDYPEETAGLVIPKDGRPLAQLATLLAEGKLTPGSYFPPEKYLKERYDVPDRAMRATVTALADAGLVDFRKGRGGSVVAATPPQDLHQSLITHASRFPANKLQTSREHRENATQVALAAATTALETALTSDPLAMRAARRDIFATAAHVAEGIDTALNAGDPLASQASLRKIFGTPYAAATEVGHILSRAGWVDVQPDHTMVTPPEARTRTPEQIRTGDVPPPISPDKPHVPAGSPGRAKTRRARGGG